MTTWLAWLLSELVGAVLGLRSAERPRGWHLDGVQDSGRADCVLDVPEVVADVATWTTLPTRAWCGAGEVGVYVSPRRAECRSRAVPFVNIPGHL